MVTSLYVNCVLVIGGALFKKWFNRIQTRWLYACWRRLLRYVLRVMVRIFVFCLLNFALQVGDYSHLSLKMDA